MIRQDPGAGTSLRRRGSVFRTTIALACAALAVVGLVTASTWLSLGFVSETFTARERDQFFIYQARVEHLRLVATLTAAAHGEATEQEARQKLDVFLGRLDTLRTAPVLEQLRQDPKMARAVAQLTRVAQEIDARAPFQVDDWLRARVEEASEPLRMAAEAVLAATVSRQQSRYEALIFRLKAGAFVFLALVSIVLGLAIMAGLQARRIARQAEEEQRLAARMQLQAAAMESAANAIFATDAALRIVWVNAAFERLSGYAAQEILGHTPALLTQGLPGAAASQDAWARVVAGEVWRGEARLRRKSGELFSVEQTITPIRGESGAVEQIVAVLDDITEQLQARERIQHMARHDLLTHLPNRAAFLERVGEAVARAQRAGSLVGVVLLDLDRFKEVNDTLGHSTGDALLCAVGQRLAAGLRQTELLARLGGDEFALVLEGLADVAQARQAVERLVAALGESFEVGGHSLQASASLGVALYPADGVEGVELLRHADLAMYAAKGNGPRPARAGGADGRSAPAGSRRHVGGLPAAGGPSHGCRGGAGGADALEPSPARRDPAGPLHPAGGGFRLDPRARPVAARAGERAPAADGRPGPGRAPRGGEPVGRAVRAGHLRRAAAGRAAAPWPAARPGRA
jgi:diguanylate cyclase (GGDEF)-like protein/PAS domain S-box-containing protein